MQSKKIFLRTYTTLNPSPPSLPLVCSCMHLAWPLPSPFVSMYCVDGPLYFTDASTFHWLYLLIPYLLINPHHVNIISLDIFRKIEPMLIMQSGISRGVSIEILLVPHRITIFFSDDGIGKLMACQRTLSMGFPPMPKFNALIQTKYSLHTLGYLIRPANEVS